MKINIEEYKSTDKFLVIWKDNWADEIDVVGVTIMTVATIEKIEIFANLFYKIHPGETASLYIGSNQNIEYRSTEDFFRSFTFVKIDEETEEVLNNTLFPGYSWYLGRIPDEEMFGTDEVWDAYDELYPEDEVFGSDAEWDDEEAGL